MFILGPDFGGRILMNIATVVFMLYVMNINLFIIQMRTRKCSHIDDNLCF